MNIQYHEKDRKAWATNDVHLDRSNTQKNADGGYSDSRMRDKRTVIIRQRAVL